MQDVFLLLVHNLILRPLVSDLYLKIWAPAGTWCVIVSARLIFLKRNFLAIADESMKTHPQFPSPLPQIQKEKANKTVATMFKKHKIKLKKKITLFAVEGPAPRFGLQRLVVLLVWASGLQPGRERPTFLLGNRQTVADGEKGKWPLWDFIFPV